MAEKRHNPAWAQEECRHENGAVRTPSADYRGTRPSSRLRDVDVGLRRALEDFVEASRHPLGVVVIVVTLVAVVFIMRFLLGLPLLPRLRVVFLERLSLEILFLLLLLF